MLTKIITNEIRTPAIIKRINGKDASNRGAFAVDQKLDITVEAPRRLGASAVVMRINRDGKADRDIPLSFVSTDAVIDTYSLSLDLADLCGNGNSGLFFYEFLFIRGVDTLFTHTDNNVDFSLERSSHGRFLLLVYDNFRKAPEWFCGRTMYHVFVDRFARGDGSVGTRNDVIINDDWHNGIPQYPEKQGEALANNMFFGGNLWGVCEKLDYLKELGVGIIYLSPVFKAYSNHKYDTGDYLSVDEMFGGEEALKALIDKANALDIKIMLDGVFNHTGNDSRYFDMYGNYGGIGAYTDENSVYRDWFCFTNYPDEYETWWGIKILPKLNHRNDSCRRFFTAEGGVGEKYIKMGIGGWRLDVVDELSDDFLDEFCKTVKSASNDKAVILGEVWENATEKIAYGKRRRYFHGGQLDSVMNYPLRKGILALLLNGDAKCLADTLKSVYSTYPKHVCDSLMNLLGTHDTERILTVLGEGREDISDIPNSILAHKKLTTEQKEIATSKLLLAAIIQYTVYGVPSVFYGDEAGMEGYHDPFCRMPFPWGKEDKTILNFYKKLGNIRLENKDVFSDGDFKVVYAEHSMIVFTRGTEDSQVFVLINASDRKAEYELDGEFVNLLNGEVYMGAINAFEGMILKKCGESTPKES